MRVITYHESDRQDHWRDKIGRSDWKAGTFLKNLLSEGTFFDNVGESSSVLLSIAGTAMPGCFLMRLQEWLKKRDYRL